MELSAARQRSGQLPAGPEAEGTFATVDGSTSLCLKQSLRSRAAASRPHQEVFIPLEF